MATSNRLTLSGMNERLRGFEQRLIGVEQEQKRADSDHQAFAIADRALEHADSATAAAVEKLTVAINDPEKGLIVQLASFRQEVATDRRIFKAYIAGAVAVLTVVWTVALALAPVIQRLLGITPN